MKKTEKKGREAVKELREKDLERTKEGTKVVACYPGSGMVCYMCVEC